MFDFFSRLFRPETSSQTAKERLRLVLLSDHLALAPDVVESLKHDLIEVISRYVEVDIAKCDVTFEREDKQVAMLANIPILGMKPPAPPPQRNDDPPVTLSLSKGSQSGTSLASASTTPDLTVNRPDVTVNRPDGKVNRPDVILSPSKDGQSTKPRRRRRKRATTNPAPQPG